MNAADHLTLDLARGLDMIERALINPAAPVAGRGLTGSGGHAGTAAAAGPPAQDAGACGAISAPAGLHPMTPNGSIRLSFQQPAGALYHENGDSDGNP